MTHLTREQILARRRGEDVVELPGGGTVKIRALTRDEVLELDDAETAAERSNMIISRGLIDPALTVDDVAQWGREADAGDLTIISEEIARISRLTEGAGKRGVARARGRRRS